MRFLLSKGAPYITITITIAIILTTIIIENVQKPTY